MIHPHNRRTRYWIDSAFQGRLVAGIVGAVVALLFAYFLAHRFLLWQMETLALGAGIPRESAYFEGITRIKFFVDVLMVVAGAGIASVGAVFMIFASHKVVGPIYKLKWFLAKISSGESVQGFKLSFRTHDHYQEIPELVNGALAQRHVTAIHKRSHP